MRSLRKFGYLACVLITFVLILGCSTVPKEVVELSYRTGEDMAALHESYDKLIHEFYEQLRFHRITYLEERWIPSFIENWIKKGKLVEVAKGQVVWSEKEEKFIPAADDVKRELFLATIQNWANEAVYEIEDKKAALLEPLDKEEEALRQDVKKAFDQLMRGNAAITAHLNSLRKVQEIQDEALEALQVKDLRDKINGALIDASDRAAEGLEIIRETDEKIDAVSTILEN